MSYRLPKKTESNTFPCCELLYKITSDGVYESTEKNDNYGKYIYVVYINDKLYLLFNESTFNNGSFNPNFVIHYGIQQIGISDILVMFINNDPSNYEFMQFYNTNPNKVYDVNEKPDIGDVIAYGKNIIIFPEKTRKYILQRVYNYENNPYRVSYNKVNRIIDEKIHESTVINIDEMHRLIKEEVAKNYNVFTGRFKESINVFNESLNCIDEKFDKKLIELNESFKEELDRVDERFNEVNNQCYITAGVDERFNEVNNSDESDNSDDNTLDESDNSDNSDNSDDSDDSDDNALYVKVIIAIIAIIAMIIPSMSEMIYEYKNYHPHIGI